MWNKILTLLACALLSRGAMAAPGRVLLLEDFENSASAANWKGGLQIAGDHVSHGRASARVRFTARRAEIAASKLASDWRGYDRLLFDVFQERQDIATASLRIYDEAGVASGTRRDYYEADGQILLLPGWNHVELKLAGLQAATYQRRIALDRIRRVVLFIDRGALPTTLHLDSFRLVQGEEPRESASRTEPQDAVTLLEDRFFQVRQVAEPDQVPESVEVRRLRDAARREAALLGEIIHAAQTQGIETIYAERHLVTADLGLHIRPRLAWFNNDATKRAMFGYVARSCREARADLQRKIDGSERLARLDDTQVGEPLIRPFPPLKGRPIRNWFYRDERGEPMIIVSLHSPSRLLQQFFASPMQHIESYSVGGGSRWTIEQSPVYAAFQQDPDTHRVGWDGWCGHLVRDLDSMGTSKPENTVICLESPRIRQAIDEYIRINIPRMHANPELLYNILAYELMYMCYCERSQQGFRAWLKTKHGTIAEANRKWSTAYKQFGDMTAPPVKGARPLPGTNRGLWYDWACFNQDRFTDHLIWVRNLVRKIDPTVPLAAGGSFSVLSGISGTTGIDEERIVNEVDDIVIHEGGGSTIGMDLQLAFAENKKPLADPEMNLGAVHHLLPHVLHGKSVIQLWHWPLQPGAEFHSNNQTSFAHGWQYTLADVNELLRAALDVRRLNNEFAAFVDTPAEVAILYSKTSTLQLAPEMLSWSTTPYLRELRSAYEASRCLDARVTFVTERQILRGKLDQYKILLVPAVRNLPADVAAKILGYVERGGRTLFVAESLIGDEYNAPAAYLERMGLRVVSTEVPRADLGGMSRDYYQSSSEHVTFSDQSVAKLTPRGSGLAASVGVLRSQGLRQKIATTANAMYVYPDGTPALVETALGRGVVYYSAATLEGDDYSRLLNALFDEAGIARLVRVRPSEMGTGARVEARLAQLGNRKLLYVVNPAAKEVRLRIDSKAWTFRGVRELRGEANTTGNVIAVPAQDTLLFELLDCRNKKPIAN